jgi:hypothetical protein
VARSGYRRVVRRLAQLDDLCLHLVVIDLVDGACQRPEILNQGVDVLRGGDRATHLVTRGHGDVVERQQVGRVRRGHQERALGEEGDRDRPVPARLGTVDHAGGALVHVEDIEVDVVEAVALRERPSKLPRVDDARVDQGLAERAAIFAPVLDHPFHALTLGESELNDHVADASHDAGALRRGGQAWNRERFGRGSLRFHTSLISAAPAVSSTGCGPCGRSARAVAVRADMEGVDHVGDLEHPRDRAMRADNRKTLPVALHTPMRVHQQREAGGIHEANAREVHHEGSLQRGKGLVEGRNHSGSRSDIELPFHGEELVSIHSAPLDYKRVHGNGHPM